MDLNVKSPNVALFGDLHLGIKSDSSNWHEIALNWCDWFIAELKSKDITEIIFLGDFFHNRSDVSVSTLHIASLILDKLADFNITMIVGNHCCFFKNRSDVHSLSLIKGRPNITVIDKNFQTTLYGKECLFLPWGSEIQENQKADYIFGHLEIQSFKVTYTKVCEHGFKTSDLFNHAKLIFSGHFHLREERKYKEGDIVYIGNPFEMDYGDLGSTKGYYILNIPSGKYEFFENTVSPKHLKVNLSELNSAAPARLSNNIVTVVVDQDIDARDLDKITANINATNAPMSLAIDCSQQNQKISVNETQKESTSSVDVAEMIGEFVNSLDVSNKSAVIEYCTDLINRV